MVDHRPGGVRRGGTPSAPRRTRAARGLGGRRGPARLPVGVSAIRGEIISPYLVPGPMGAFGVRWNGDDLYLTGSDPVLRQLEV